MRNSYAPTRYPLLPLPDRGFTLIELLVAMVVGMLLLSAFTVFYLSEQRAVRHHQIEVETSQELRTALEQISRDLRSARKDLTRDFLASTGGAQPTFRQAERSWVEFELDANDNGTIDLDLDPNDDNVLDLLPEYKGFRLPIGGTTVEQLQYVTDSNSYEWIQLADSVQALTFNYWICGATPAAALIERPSVTLPAELTDIVQVDIAITMDRPVIAGLPVSRTENVSVKLRNVRCS
ncbi:MAG: PilW family protein [bacterium]